MLGQLVRAVVAETGMDVGHWQEHTPTVEQAAERLEAEDRAADERYDQMVKERMASLEADFEEGVYNRPESRVQEKCLKVKYVGMGYRNGVTGKAYPRREDQYWFQPDTGAMGVRVRAEDLEFLDNEISEG